ncbi:MAG: undecaprenyl-diphosphate phosphatase [Candidatus Hydrogenedentota bacterium]
MTTFEAVLLGIVQGVFMFFPVSSTSHLALTQHWLIRRGSALPAPESAEMILFDLVVHVGTLVSIALVLRHSIWAYCRGVISEVRQSAAERRAPLRERLHLRLTLWGLLAVFVTGTVGLTFRDLFEQVFAHPLAMAVTLTLTGALLWWTDTFTRLPRGLKQLTPVVAIVVGLAQAFALIPGLSRSGMTIAFGLITGLKRRWAAEFSLFIAFPTIIAATGVQALDVLRDDAEVSITLWPLAVGFVVAAVVGAGALTLVLRLLYSARFRYFSYYVWLLAAAVVIWHFIGTVPVPR